MLPSRDEAKSTPPAVASTPFESEPWNSLKSQTVFPVSGSMALIPALGGGSFAVLARRRASSGRATEILAALLRSLRRAHVLSAGLRVFQVEQPGDRAVRRRLEIGAAAGCRIDEEAALRTRVRSRNGHRPPLLVEALVPGLVDERRARQERAGGAIEHVEMAVAIGVHQQLPLLAAPHAIHEDHVLRRVPVVAVVGRELIVPLALAGVGIERDDRIGEQVVAVAAHRPIGHRGRIADRPVDACRAPDRTCPSATCRRRRSSSCRPSTCRCRTRPVPESCRTATAACRSRRRRRGTRGAHIRRRHARR